MANFTQEEIERLISCLKEISDPPARELRRDGGQLRKDAKMIATDGTKGVFNFFVRKNADFAENFSVGLAYSPNDGRPEITLLRCNGKHGIFNNGRNGFDANHPHWNFHIHKASQDALDSGLAAIIKASVTSEFASVEEAVLYLLKTVNLKPLDVKKHFSVESQIHLDFSGE